MTGPPAPLSLSLPSRSPVTVRIWGELGPIRVHPSPHLLRTSWASLPSSETTAASPVDLMWLLSFFPRGGASVIFSI